MAIKTETKVTYICDICNKEIQERGNGKVTYDDTIYLTIPHTGNSLKCELFCRDGIGGQQVFHYNCLLESVGRGINDYFEAVRNNV